MVVSECSLVYLDKHHTFPIRLGNKIVSISTNRKRLDGFGRLDFGRFIGCSRLILKNGQKPIDHPPPKEDTKETNEYASFNTCQPHQSGADNASKKVINIRHGLISFGHDTLQSVIQCIYAITRANYRQVDKYKKGYKYECKY